MKPIPLAPWNSVYREMGGYDCLFGAFDILSRGGEQVAQVDLRHYGQNSCRPPLPEVMASAQAVAHLIAAAPDLLSLLDEACALMSLGSKARGEWLVRACEARRRARGAVAGEVPNA